MKRQDWKNIIINLIKGSNPGYIENSIVIDNSVKKLATDWIHVTKKVCKRLIRTWIFVCKCYSSIIHNIKKWKQPKCPSTYEWIKKYMSILSNIIPKYKRRSYWFILQYVWTSKTCLVKGTTHKRTHIVWFHFL